MKNMKKTLALMGIPLLLILMLINLYKPIKENYIYNKKLVFSNIDLKYNDSKNIEDSKFISKAEEILLNLLEDKFDKTKYNASVNFNSFYGPKYNDIVEISFLDKSSKNNLAFIITFDLSSGEIIELSNFTTTDNSNENKPSDSYLFDAARKYLHKLTKYNYDSLTFNTVKNKYYYTLYATTKNNSIYISIVLDINTGSFKYYRNINSK